MTRMKEAILLLALLPLFAGCSTPPYGPPDVRNIHSARLHKDPGVCIMVISDDRKGQMWFKAEDEWEIESLKNVPQSCFHAVHLVSISPDDKILAVISVGEGHPYLEVFDLNGILTTRDSENDLPVKPLLAIDPYPGNVWVEGWEKDKIVLSSDMPLDRLDKTERRSPVPDPMLEPRRFLWHVATDTIAEE